MPFFADNHVSGDSGAQDNKLTAAATDPDNPTTDEFKEALKVAIGTMLAFKDDQGDPMALSTGGLLAVVPTTMLLTALEALNSTVVSNTKNALEGAARIIAFPWISDASKWYLLKTDGVVRPFIFQDREPIEFSALTEDGHSPERARRGIPAREVPLRRSSAIPDDLRVLAVRRPHRLRLTVIRAGWPVIGFQPVWQLTGWKPVPRPRNCGRKGAVPSATESEGLQ